MYNNNNLGQQRQIQNSQYFFNGNNDINKNDNSNSNSNSNSNTKTMSFKLQNLKKKKQINQLKYQVQVDVDQILTNILDDKYRQTLEKYPLTEPQFISLCRQCKNILLSQSSLLKLSGPIIVSTGTVGYYKDLTLIFAKCGSPSMNNYLFLGDYTGRGDRNLQCLILLMCYKIKYQDNFFMLRGCMDSIAMTRSYNFYEQCIDRLSPKSWSQACQFLCSLPFSAVIQNKIFCTHGGLSPELQYIQQIDRIPRPIQTPQSNLLCDLVWSQINFRQDSVMWTGSDRGYGWAFHQKILQQFLRENRLEMIIRGHDVVYNGFQYSKEKNIGTICSLANYSNLCTNSAAVFILNSQLQAYFKVIKQRNLFPSYSQNQSYNGDSASLMLKKIMENKRQLKKKILLQGKISEKMQQRDSDREIRDNSNVKNNKGKGKFMDWGGQKLMKIQQGEQQQYQEQLLERRSLDDNYNYNEIDDGQKVIQNKDDDDNEIHQDMDMKLKVMMGRAQVISQNRNKNSNIMRDTEQQVNTQSDEDKL